MAVCRQWLPFSDFRIAIRRRITRPNCPEHSSSRSFFSGNRSLDRAGVYGQLEFLSNELREFARPYGRARHELLLDEGQHLALEFVRAAWTTLSGYQPSDAGVVEAGSGLVIRRSRHAVLLGGIGHRRVLDRNTAQQLVLNLHQVTRI